MGHAVLPWESFLSIPDRWLSPGLCPVTSKVEVLAVSPGRACAAGQLSLLGKPTKRLEQCLEWGQAQ